MPDGNRPPPAGPVAYEPGADDLEARRRRRRRREWPIAFVLWLIIAGIAAAGVYTFVSTPWNR